MKRNRGFAALASSRVNHSVVEELLYALNNQGDRKLIYISSAGLLCIRKDIYEFTEHSTNKPNFGGGLYRYGFSQATTKAGTKIFFVSKTDLFGEEGAFDPNADNSQKGLEYILRRMALRAGLPALKRTAPHDDELESPPTAVPRTAAPRWSEVAGTPATPVAHESPPKPRLNWGGVLEQLMVAQFATACARLQRQVDTQALEILALQQRLAALERVPSPALGPMLWTDRGRSLDEEAVDATFQVEAPTPHSPAYKP